jgi:hypothetical protein
MNKQNNVKIEAIKDINICRQIMFMSDNSVNNRIVMPISKSKNYMDILASLPQKCSY